MERIAKVFANDAPSAYIGIDKGLGDAQGCKYQRYAGFLGACLTKLSPIVTTHDDKRPSVFDYKITGVILARGSDEKDLYQTGSGL